MHQRALLVVKPLLSRSLLWRSTLPSRTTRGVQAATEEIMTPDPVTISQGASIGEAARVMLDYKISGLPMLDNDEKLVGIITESDIFRMVVQEWSKA
jgi:CBS domain-containing protein